MHLMPIRVMTPAWVGEHKAQFGAEDRFQIIFVRYPKTTILRSNNSKPENKQETNMITVKELKQALSQLSPECDRVGIKLGLSPLSVWMTMSPAGKCPSKPSKAQSSPDHLFDMLFINYL